MRMSDWSSDVCSSDLLQRVPGRAEDVRRHAARPVLSRAFPAARNAGRGHAHGAAGWGTTCVFAGARACPRSEEHTSELQSLMRISYAVFCLKKKKYANNIYNKKVCI